MKTRLVLVAAFLSVFLVGSGCTLQPDFDRSLNSIVKPYRFDIIGWEFKTLFGGDDKADGDVSTVRDYFALVGEIQSLESEMEAVGSGDRDGNLALLEAQVERLRQEREALACDVETVLTGQIEEVLAGEGIYSPLDSYIGLGVCLPPVNFRLERPPKLLVISPRDRIESMREILLEQNLSLEEVDAIEAEADKLGVSSLVVEIGGLAATYPSFVSDEASLGYTISAAVEEWVHQYLAFTPLGFLYLLDVSGLARNYEIATINETVAGMVSKEIRAILCQEYYPECLDTAEPEKNEPDFDFNLKMREIRKAVDGYLSRGEIEEAERFMEWERQYLASKGYYIRKLNQAYFAFYGTYADRPTSISPIGGELKAIRDRSASLRDFLDTVSVITSREKLKEDY